MARQHKKQTPQQEPEDATYHGRYNFGMPFYLVTILLNGAAGIYLASSIPQDGPLSEVSVVMAILKLMGFWGLLFVRVTQTRINTANYYLATVNMQAFFGNLLGLHASRLLWAMVVGAVVYVLMLADVFSYLLKALAYQGVFVVAWVGVALAHILAAPDQGSTIDDAAGINRAGLGAWFCGVIPGFVLMEMAGFWPSLSAPLTFVSSMGVYVLLQQRGRAAKGLRAAE